MLWHEMGCIPKLNGGHLEDWLGFTLASLDVIFLASVGITVGLSSFLLNHV